MGHIGRSTWNSDAVMTLSAGGAKACLVERSSCKDLHIHSCLKGLGNGPLFAYFGTTRGQSAIRVVVVLVISLVLIIVDATYF